MGNTGYFLPIIILFAVGATLLMGLIDKWTESKSSYDKWLGEELGRNPDYIDWLKKAHGGRDYKTGLRILARIKRDRSKVFYRLLRKIRG